jgi:hypothetical protein
MIIKADRHSASHFTIFTFHETRWLVCTILTNSWRIWATFQSCKLCSAAQFIINWHTSICLRLYYHLGCDAVKSGRSSPTFRRKTMPPPSSPKTARCKQADDGRSGFLRNISNFWQTTRYYIPENYTLHWFMLQVTSKCRYPPTRLQAIIT